MIYKGNLGERITTIEQLQELAKNRKSIATMTTVDNNRGKVRFIGVTPAKVFLYRQCADVMRILKSGTLYRYIKPPTKPKVKSFSANLERPGKREGIKRLLTIMLECEGHLEDSYGMMYVLKGLDPATANSVKDEKQVMLPDSSKVRAELKKLREAGKQ